MSDKQCEHCGTKNTYALHKHFASTTLLLGLSLVGCGDKKTDTSTTDTASEASSEPTIEPAIEPPYGVPDTGQKEDE